MTHRKRSLIIAAGLLALLFGLHVLYDADGPMSGAAWVDRQNEEQFLQSSHDRMDWEEVLAWSPEQRVAGFRNHDRIYTTSTVFAGNHVRPLPSHPEPLLDVTYRIWNFERHPVLIPMFRTYDLDDFLRHNNVTGLIAVKSGKVVLERYAAGNTKETLWGSMSVTKSIVSLLAGAAISDGFIRDTDDLISEYLPALEGTAYDSVTVEHLLRLSTGISWVPDYENPDWVRAQGMSATELTAFLGSQERSAFVGKEFNYNDEEVNVLSAVVSAAVGQNLASYLEARIWKPAGMEEDATWMMIPDSLHTGGCCFSASLRDYARLGMFALNNGRLGDSTAVLPPEWMHRSTQPSESASNYGYLWWLYADGSYAAMGIHGQLIHINPEEELVVAIQSAWETATGDDYYVHQDAFISAMTRLLDTTRTTTD